MIQVSNRILMLMSIHNTDVNSILKTSAETNSSESASVTPPAHDKNDLTTSVTSTKNKSKIIRSISVEPMNVDTPDGPFRLIIPNDLDLDATNITRVTQKNSAEQNATNTDTTVIISPNLSQRNSTEHMNIDEDNIHDNLDNDYFKSCSLDKAETGAGTYITTKEFEYTMKLFDEKLNSLYKLCRFISDTQQENKKSLKKLVALDELSGVFWNVSYLFSNSILFILILKYNYYLVACI